MSFGLGGIGHAEFRQKETEEVALGINTSTADVALARISRETGLRLMTKFCLKNKGKGNATVKLKKRGEIFPIAAEDISALQVGATAKVQGKLANRRIEKNTVVILDDNAVTPQRVEDSGDGRLLQTDGPAGPTYPVEVGKINYIEGTVEFTFAQAITAPIVADYNHSDWTEFGTPIALDVAAGGGEQVFVVKPTNAQNYLSGIKGQKEVGWFGTLQSANDQETLIGMVVSYHYDDNLIKLPLEKGEVNGYPFHNN